MTISNICSKATEPIVIKSHLEPPGAEGTKICSNEQYGHHTHIWLNPLKIVSSRTSRSMALQLSMKLWYYQDCSNDDLVLTLTYFTSQATMGKW